MHNNIIQSYNVCTDAGKQERHTIPAKPQALTAHYTPALLTSLSTASFAFLISRAHIELPLNDEKAVRQRFWRANTRKGVCFPAILWSITCIYVCAVVVHTAAAYNK